MYIVIVTDVMENGDPVVLTNDESEMPQTFASIADIEELKEDHMLMACDWWAFDCDTGKTRLLDA
jgi:hypothetical protein